MVPLSTIFQAGRSYDFHNYVDLPFEPEDILRAFDYTLRHDTLDLMQGFVPPERSQELQYRITRSLR
ncbi:MAG: hypothetical protein ACK421_08990, partial [Pseudanabaenaceae cyanobacterium]